MENAALNTAPTVPAKPGWGQRLGRVTIRLTIAALVIAAGGLTLARYDLIPKLAGFSALLGGALISLFAVLIGLAALIAGRKAVFPAKAKVIAALVVGVVYVGFIASRPLLGGDHPAIHDVTTDLANPPQFETLPLRADNLAGVGTVENWRTVHSAAYGHLKPVIVAKPVAAVTADAVRIAGDAGWDIVSADPARGHIEATASVSFIRFNDDVVIRIAPTADGRASRVDVRSVSRVGVADFGVNAARIEAFLAKLPAN